MRNDVVNAIDYIENLVDDLQQDNYYTDINNYISFEQAIAELKTILSFLV